MIYNLEQIEKKVQLSINSYKLCEFIDAILISPSQFETQNCIVDVLNEDEKIKIKFSAVDFEVVSMIFDSITKINTNTYLHSDESGSGYYLNCENSTLISSKNLIFTVDKVKIVTLAEHTGVKNNEKQLNDLKFTTLMYVPGGISTISSLRTPPSFSISLYKDSNLNIPLLSYKDKQIISGISTVYVSAISNFSVVPSNFFTLVSIDSFNNTKKYKLIPFLNNNTLTQNAYQYGLTTQINFSKSDFINYLDGSLKFFVSVSNFVFSSTIRTKTLINSSIDAYFPINTMSTISTSHINSANIRVGIVTYSFSQLGYSSLSAFPIYTYNVGLSSFNSFPTLSTSSYVSIGYTSLYNNQVGASLIYNFGTTAIGFSTFNFAGVTFISEDDLSSSSVNLQNYDIKFLLKYNNAVEPLIIYPLSQNISQTSITANQIPYNFISAKIPFSQLIDPSKTLISLEARIAKTPTYSPVNFRVYEFKIFNYGISTITSNQFNPLSLQKNTEIFPSSENEIVFDTQSILGVKKGDFIYGFRNTVEKTKVLEIYDGINENIYTIETEQGIIEIPESYQVFTHNDFINLWKIKKGDEILSMNGYTKVLNIHLGKYQPHFVIHTDVSNYFANGILIKPHITAFHKKTKTNH